MKIIDSHTHLYQPDFDGDRDDVIQRANDLGVERFYLPGIDKAVWPRMMDMQERYAGVFAMPGLHPVSVGEHYQDELDFVEAQLKSGGWPAIGEIGLDFYWDKTFTRQQFEVFHKQMEWALDLNLPIVIHTRNAMQETIETVKPFAEKGLRGVFHCFTDNLQSAKQIVDMEFLLGIGGVLTYKNARLPEVLVHLSLEHLILETDAPYLTPVPFRGKRNESSYLRYVIETLAETYQVTPEEVAARTTENALNLYKT